MAAASALQRLYGSIRLYVNFFQPPFKLASKQREGAVVHKRYYPPLTPYQRLLASAAVDETVKRRLREQFVALDPVVLLKAIREVQQQLLALSNHEIRAAAAPAQPEYLNAFATAWHNDYRAPKERRKTVTKHWWRTRADPFAESLPLVESWLMTQNNLTAKELLTRLSQRLPDLYPRAFTISLREKTIIEHHGFQK